MFHGAPPPGMQGGMPPPGMGELLLLVVELLLLILMMMVVAMVTRLCSRESESRVTPCHLTGPHSSHVVARSLSSSHGRKRAKSFSLLGTVVGYMTRILRFFWP